MQGTAATCAVCGAIFNGATHAQTCDWADFHDAKTGHADIDIA
jgi:hypothetical protein